MTAGVPFGSRLRAVTRERGPLCVGIDPHPGLLAAWGLPDSAEGVLRFSATVVEALAGRVAVLKPQSAFFERHGSAGVAVLERVLADVAGSGTLTLLDVKRGDIGSTMAAYADAYADPRSPLCADAVTVSPFLGFGSLDPLLDRAATHGGGVFVLALTSNAEGPSVQAARDAEGRSVAETVLAGVRGRNAGSVAVGEQGSIGAVVGLTGDPPDVDLDVGGPLLAPGLGAQGGAPADLLRVFGRLAHAALPSASRAVLGAGPDVIGLRTAAAELAEACHAALPAH